MDGIVVRRGKSKDAAALAAMANRLNRLMGKSDDPFTATTIRRDGLGRVRAFETIVAATDDRLAGYAFFQDFYNTDRAARGAFLHDLYVEAAFRGRGIGRAILAAVAAAAVDAGACSLWWGVLDSNTGARAFYAKLGARDEAARILELDGAALDRLAAEAQA